VIRSISPGAVVSCASDTITRIGTSAPTGAQLRAAVELASDVEGLRLVLASALSDRYDVTP
jgi:hypothetical protein